MKRQLTRSKATNQQWLKGRTKHKGRPNLKTFTRFHIGALMEGKRK